MAKYKKKNSKSGLSPKSEKGFISPVMAQYLKFGDYDPSEVATKALVHRDRTYDPSIETRTSYGGIARGQGYKAYRHGGKLWKINPTGGPDTQKTT